MAFAVQAIEKKDLEPSLMSKLAKFATSEMITSKAASHVHETGKEDCIMINLQDKLCNTKEPIKMVLANLTALEHMKTEVFNENQNLLDQIITGDVDSILPKFVPVLELLKELEQQESNFWSICEHWRSDLEAEISELDRKTLKIEFSGSCFNNLDQHLNNSMEKLNRAKIDLASKLRVILLLYRQLDEVPSASELIQYEHRFSELYVQIQGKHRKTRKYYGTYNALIEVKEIMLKELSLLNSISSQFQDAIGDAASRTKLIGSMEGILKGTQQKLEKVQSHFNAAQKTCETLKQKCAAALTEQQHYSSLLKAFQEEYARSKNLQSLASVKRS